MPKVLVVEDDQFVAAMISDALKHERVEVETASDGQLGLHMLTSLEYDMVILDWDLPHISGIELCRKLRARGMSVPVLMLTGKGLIHEKEAGFDSGADDYLTKPFNIRELVARVKSALRRAGGATFDGCLRVGDLVLDAKAFIAWRGNDKLDLVRKEFRILEFLMRHPNQVFSPESLIEHVWGRDSEVSLDVVKVWINRLRKKLQSTGEGTALIESVYGAGYRLNRP